MTKNRQILKTVGIVLLVFIFCVIFIEPLRSKMNALFMLRDRGELKEEEVIGTVIGYNPRVKETQEVLKLGGFYSGQADGFMGIQTRKAIRDFQKAKGLEVTGRINQNTFLALNRHSEMIKSLPAAGVSAPAILKVAGPPAKKQEPLKSVTVLAAKKPEIPQAPEKENFKSRDIIRKIQSALKKANFYNGKIDGIMGAKTKEALRALQKSKGLKADGVVGPKTWGELNRYFDKN